MDLADSDGREGVNILGRKMSDPRQDVAISCARACEVDGMINECLQEDVEGVLRRDRKRQVAPNISVVSVRSLALDSASANTPTLS